MYLYHNHITDVFEPVFVHSWVQTGSMSTGTDTNSNDDLQVCRRHYLPPASRRKRSKSTRVFCRNNFSLLKSIAIRRASILRTCMGAPSGGHDMNRSMTGTIGFCSESASVRSRKQFSLCRYFAVTQQSITDATLRCRCATLCGVSLSSD